MSATTETRPKEQRRQGRRRARSSLAARPARAWSHPARGQKGMKTHDEPPQLSSPRRRAGAPMSFRLPPSASDRTWKQARTGVARRCGLELKEKRPEQPATDASRRSGQSGAASCQRRGTSGRRSFGGLRDTEKPCVVPFNPRSKADERIRCISSSDGDPPFSHLDTVPWPTPARSENSCCVALKTCVLIKRIGLIPLNYPFSDYSQAKKLFPNGFCYDS